MADENSEHDEQAGKGPDLSAIAQAIGHGAESGDVAVTDKAAGKPEKSPRPGRNGPPKQVKTGRQSGGKPKKAAEVTGSPTVFQRETNSTEKAETMNDMNSNNEQANGLNDMTATMQDRAQAFYQRSTELASDVTEFTRGNAEALVEAGRVWATGLQDIGRSTLEETRTAVEGMTEGAKRLAAVKSPTELLQLQGELAQRNMDAFIKQASRNTETFLKLANDAFAPMSSRLSVAVEKFSKAA
ncbi:phasin family protein [Porphyrobacter sp. GA68]|uniref:phasin family protein n=1 Tax=Porphyrobacter sp. GA68 TaxID=2883480 RepID=UPI001D1988DA|nr:phasin family protein [Porphyrobacter sp. GA68]